MNRVMTDYYRQLLGRKIVQIVESSEHPPTPGFLLDDGKTVWIQCDPEGNGPGFLQIEKPAGSRRTPGT